MGRLFSPCNTVVVCISYGLTGSLVTMNDHGTHMIAGLVVCGHGTHALTELVMCNHQTCT